MFDVFAERGDPLEAEAFVELDRLANRIGASRLQQIAHTLQVSVSFFFEGAPSVPGHHPDGMSEAPSPAYVSDFLATSDGLALTKAFMRIKDAKLRRRIVDLVEQMVVDGDR
jgi:hypothetical protein